MARQSSVPLPTGARDLTVCHMVCATCSCPLYRVHHAQRTIRRLDGVWRLTLSLVRCHNRACANYRRLCRPEAEGAWALPHGEFGFDVIAFVGHLRYTQHRSIPEIHQQLRLRGVVIAERTVTNLLARYEELIAMQFTSMDHLQERFVAQGQVILGLDGLKPDVGHEVLWVLRDCLSGDVLLARSLLSECEEEVAELIREVQVALPVPITGVISDGQQSIRRAVEQALPGVPHQLCQYHYIREAAKPIYEADRHAKKELKRHVRGIRPIERALECVLFQDESLDGQGGRNGQNAKGGTTRHARKLGVMELLTIDEAKILQGYCHAIRSALTDDGQPPLCAAGLRLHERLTDIVASIQRLLDMLHQPSFHLSWTMAFTLERLRDTLQQGLDATASLWPAIRQGYAWVAGAMAILANDEHLAPVAVRTRYGQHLEVMKREASTRSDSLELPVWCALFLKVSASYGEQLFRCYALPTLPRTNNDLEHLFGSVRYHERRCSGRKQVAPSLLLRGAARLFATVGALVTTRALGLRTVTEVAQWRTLRRTLDRRQETRRAQRRFRQDPKQYLHLLEGAVMQCNERVPMW